MKKLISLSAMILALTMSTSAFANSTAEGRTYMPLKSSPNANKASFDIQFLDTMIAHHRQGIEMAEMAGDKSQNESVKTKSHAMIENMQSELSDMQSIRDDIQEKAPEAISMTMDGMSSLDLKGLNSETAKNFDEKFVKMAIKHKEGEREMAKKAVKRAKNAKVVEFAKTLAGKATGELAELREMEDKM